MSSTGKWVPLFFPAWLAWPQDARVRINTDTCHVGEEDTLDSTGIYARDTGACMIYFGNAEKDIRGVSGYSYQIA